MLKRSLFGIVVFTLFVAAAPGVGGGKVEEDLYVVGKSEQRFSELFMQGVAQGYFYYEELTRRLLPEFAGIPYGSGGSGCPSDKTLVNFQ